MNGNPHSAWRLALALAAVGCSAPWTEARLTRPVSMSPMADPRLSVQARRVLVMDATMDRGIDDGALLGLEIDITNADAEPYTLNGASFSCWMELSPDRPAETLSLAPAGGGEGRVQSDLSVDGMQLGSLTIPPGQTRAYWVMFRGYRYPGSDVPRKITVWFPDARGRRVELVIADPARGDLRWEVDAPSLAFTYGVQNTALFAQGFSAMATSGQISAVSRVGPFFWDVGLTARLLIESKGLVQSETSGFSGLGLHAHLTLPILTWGSSQSPRRLGPYAGAEASQLLEIVHQTSTASAARAYGVVSLEGGLELDFDAQAPAASPFPISFSARSRLPRWGIRVGYTHWFVFGNSNSPDVNSGGYTTAIRFRF